MDARSPQVAPRRRGLAIGFAIVALLLLAVLALLLWAVPLRDGVRDWTAPLIPRGWMAWTFPVALFFWLIAVLLVLFSWLALRFPETPRRGLLWIDTTRGDRLFLGLLGTAFICLGWLFLVGSPVWWGLAIGLVWSVAVFALL